MKMPRDVSGDELVTLLKKLGYEVSRQTGSHIRLATNEHGKHLVTIPKHKHIKIGTLNNILNHVANHLTISKDEIITLLWK